MPPQRFAERFAPLTVYIAISVISEDPEMWGQKQEGGDGMAGSAQSDGSEASLGLRQASDAIDKLRSRIDQASQAMRELTQVTEQWAEGTQHRVRGMAKELRHHGERAVDSVSRQVEHNPMTSVAIAFAIGFLCATLIRR
jgi:ElaB/YqjD/DUF883 family membrane-anchored ribosome-binding protein